jgi:hypothetical protein
MILCHVNIFIQSFKLSINPNETNGLHYELFHKKNMLVELCIRNYVTLYGFVNLKNCASLKFHLVHLIKKHFIGSKHGKIDPKITL